MSKGCRVSRTFPLGPPHPCSPRKKSVPSWKHASVIERCDDDMLITASFSISHRTRSATNNGLLLFTVLLRCCRLPSVSPLSAPASPYWPKRIQRCLVIESINKQVNKIARSIYRRRMRSQRWICQRVNRATDSGSDGSGHTATEVFAMGSVINDGHR